MQQNFNSGVFLSKTKFYAKGPLYVGPNTFQIFSFLETASEKCCCILGFSRRPRLLTMQTWQSFQNVTKTDPSDISFWQYIISAVSIMWYLIANVETFYELIEGISIDLHCLYARILLICSNIAFVISYFCKRLRYFHEFLQVQIAIKWICFGRIERFFHEHIAARTNWIFKLFPKKKRSKTDLANNYFACSFLIRLHAKTPSPKKIQIALKHVQICMFKLFYHHYAMWQPS